MITGPTKWTYLDYVDVHGVNRIAEWLKSLPLGARVEFDSLLITLKPVRILDRPQVGKLGRKHGEDCKGLYEFVVKFGNVQYRPIFFYGPDSARRQITILAGAKERDGKFEPRGICKIALNRMNEVKANIRQVVNHVRV
jgi:hypothetical protein